MAAASTRARSTAVRRLASARAQLYIQPLQGEQALVEIVRQSRDESIKEAAVEALVDHAQSQWPHDKRGAFMTQVARSAILAGRSHRVPPSITIAQAILESGWGRSRLARNHHNLFGMKASTTQAGVLMPTLEYTAAGVRIEPARFRIYSSTDESMTEHAKLLATDARYAPARAHAQNWRAFLSKLAPVYATDPQYPRRIIQIIDRYGLDRWDGVVRPNPPATPDA